MTGMAGFRSASATFLMAGALYGQALTISPKSVSLRQVEGGPLAASQIVIRSADNAPHPWTAIASTSDPNDPWIELSAGSGTTPATLMIGLVNWRGEKRKPGKYTGSITVRSNGASQTVPVEWQVRAALPPPSFTYLQGPKGCEKSDGYPDPPLCAMLP